VARAGWLCAALASLGACKSDAERARLGQVARLADQIERLRRADNPDKRPLLEQLIGTDCPDAEACGLKDLCVRAYRLHQSALDSITALQAFTRSDAAAPAPANLGDRLTRTREDLEHARQLSEDCAAEQIRVVRKSLL
jgi:hypothetical protein